MQNLVNVERREGGLRSESIFRYFLCSIFFVSSVFFSLIISGAERGKTNLDNHSRINLLTEFKL